MPQSATGVGKQLPSVLYLEYWNITGFCISTFKYPYIIERRAKTFI